MSEPERVTDDNFEAVMDALIERGLVTLAEKNGELGFALTPLGMAYVMEIQRAMARSIS